MVWTSGSLVMGGREGSGCRTGRLHMWWEFGWSGIVLNSSTHNYPRPPSLQITPPYNSEVLSY